MSLIEQLNLLSAQAFRFGSPKKQWSVGEQVWKGMLEAASEELLSVNIVAQFPHGQATVVVRSDFAPREVRVTDPRALGNKKANPTFKDIGELCVPG
jgi:hypothetical protein